MKSILSKCLLLIGVLILIQPAATAQDLATFKKLKSEGEIPSFFIQYLNEKIEEDNEKLEDDQTISVRNAKDFSAITNYQLQRLLRGGKVLYGDAITTYANGVLDKLKEASSEDLDYIQLYTIKSNEVNAFATHQGLIFITVGLIGQLENEAQLAYVLAHELTHVIEKHNQLSYQHSQDLMNSGRYGDQTISDYYKYSRDNEEESDKAGFELALAAGYDATSIYRSFDVLLYSYLPVDEIPLDYSRFEDKSFKIPEKWRLPEEKVNGITAAEDIDDEFLTHPNIAKRKRAVASIYKENKGEDNAEYIYATEAEFKKIRNVARFEMVNNFIRTSDYIRGLYHSFVLEKDFPNNSFIKRSQSMMWYGLSAFESRGNDNPYSTSYRKVEGEIQHFYYMLNKMRTHEISALAMREIWEAKSDSTSGETIALITQRAANEFVRHEENKLVNFSKIHLEEVEQEIEEPKDENEELSKYDKIAKKKKETSTEEVCYYMLVDAKSDDEFLSIIDKANDHVQEKEAREEELEERDDLVMNNELDVEKILMVTPNVYVKDSRKSVKKSVTNNEMNETMLIKTLEDNAEKLDLQINYIDNFRDPSFTTENYNEFSTLYDYLGERSNFSGQDFLPYNSMYTQGLIDKYGTNYVGLVSIYSEIEARPFNAGYALLGAVTLYGFPLYLKWQFTKDKQTDFGFVMFNLETHNPSFVSQKRYYADMNKYLQSAHIYNALHQIKK